MYLKEAVPDNIKLFIFDCDGTIVSNVESYSQANYQTYKSYGLDVEYDWVLSRTGYTGTQVLQDLCREQGKQIDRQTFLRDRDLILHPLLDEVGIVKASHDFILEMHGKIPMVVASNGLRKNVHKVLDAVGLRKYFKHVLVNEDVVNLKPHPDLFLKAAAMCNVTPDQCFVFEDSEPGFTAAQAAGMKYLDIKVYY